MKTMTREEVDELLALAETPDPKPRVRAVYTDKARELLRAFLTDVGLRPGRTAGIEVCSLYRFYRDWNASCAEPRPRLLRPFSFARELKAHGYRRMRLKRNNIERRPLGLHRSIAARFRGWLRSNPDTDADRKLFDPKTRLQKGADRCNHSSP